MIRSLLDHKTYGDRDCHLCHLPNGLNEKYFVLRNISLRVEGPQSQKEGTVFHIPICWRIISMLIILGK